MVENVSDFVVQDIWEKHFVDGGKTEYHRKWLGFPTDQTLQVKSAAKRRLSMRVVKKPKSSKFAKPKNRRGYERGLEMVQILAVVDDADGVKYLVKWRSCTKLDLVAGEVVAENDPHLLIEFYELQSELARDAEQPMPEEMNEAGVDAEHASDGGDHTADGQ